MSGCVSESQGWCHLVALGGRALRFLESDSGVSWRSACWACLVDAKAMHGNGVVRGGLVQESGVAGTGRSTGHDSELVPFIYTLESRVSARVTRGQDAGAASGVLDGVVV